MPNEKAAPQGKDVDFGYTVDNLLQLCNKSLQSSITRALI